ncbi:putative quinol monooxygenase [Devosia nitrariae]|uniref:ABM domain-containing protein n=1 Tax=Devosia nitrariae TaxID=2071872 RepID=A0ABQ5WBR1_9HYPH|nr:antibiotic biosynthesis monooxygenase [Devosia nitrariae]GLQ57229.1 hypothetical protein GCM10010862_44880 [Devosia nitrariae]
MLVVHLRFTVAPETRQQTLETLVAGAPVVRAMPGCIAYIPFSDPTDDTAVGILQEWEAGEDLAAYTASETFRSFGAALRPMMTAKPVSKRFSAELIEVIN